MAASKAILHKGNSVDDVARLVSQYICERSQKAVATRGRFTIALSGGSMPKVLGQGFQSLEEKPDVSKWHVFFADERCVPLDHADSNFKANYDLFLKTAGVPRGQIYTIKEGLSPEDAAVAYAQTMAEVFEGEQTPQVDLVMLGMGPDGHTCSLFPGHSLNRERNLLIAPIKDSPKPPPERITFTFPLLEAATEIAFITTGDNKKDLIPQVIGLKPDEPTLPSAEVVRGAKSAVHFFLDDAAGANIPDPIASASPAAQL